MLAVSKFVGEELLLSDAVGVVSLYFSTNSYNNLIVVFEFYSCLTVNNTYSRGISLYLLSITFIVSIIYSCS